MPREKIRKTDKVVPVDMGTVKDLKSCRLKRNYELDGTGKFCNLLWIFVKTYAIINHAEIVCHYAPCAHPRRERI